MSVSKDPTSQRAVPKETGEPADDTQYESAFKPLVWLLIPFIGMLIYGFLSHG